MQPHLIGTAQCGPEVARPELMESGQLLDRAYEAKRCAMGDHAIPDQTRAQSSVIPGVVQGQCALSCMTFFGRWLQRREHGGRIRGWRTGI